MKTLFTIVIQYEDGYGERAVDWTSIVRDDNYLSSDDSWRAATEYFESNDMDYEIEEVFSSAVTEVDGHKVRVVCKPQERSEQ